MPPATPTTTFRRVTLAVALSSAGACKSGLPDLDGLQAWDGNYVTYHASPSLTPCAGTPGYVDGFVPFVASELGIDAPTDLRYVWLDDQALAKTSCVDSGCQIENYAIAPQPAWLHELVHAVTSPAAMNSWPFFTEGIATAYDPWGGDGMAQRYAIPLQLGEPLPDPRPMMVQASPHDVHYGIAGSFVAFLLARHGPDRYVDFVQRLPQLQSLDKLRSLFSEIYGRDLDDEAELFMVGAPCEADPFPVLPYDCTMPEVPWADGDAWSYSTSSDCEAEDVMGGFSPDQSWWSIHSVTLDVPRTGRYLFSAQSDGDVQIQIGACFGCPWEKRWFLIDTGEAREVELDPGSYYVRIRRSSKEAPPLDVYLFGPDGPI